MKPIKKSVRLAINDYGEALAKLERDASFFKLVHAAVSCDPQTYGTKVYERVREAHGRLEAEKLKLVENFIKHWIKEI